MSPVKKSKKQFKWTSTKDIRFSYRFLESKIFIKKILFETNFADDKSRIKSVKKINEFFDSKIKGLQN